MESFFSPLLVNPVNIEPLINNERWLRFNIISHVNFTVNSPVVPSILSSVNAKPKSVKKWFCDHRNSTWENVNNIPSRPLTRITKGPKCAVTHSFPNSVKADMDFRRCLSPFYFIDQRDTSCMGFWIKCPWSFFAHTEIGSGAYFVLLNKGVKIWCAFTSSTGSRSFEQCYHSPEGFKELMQRGPREREARFLQFFLQHPGDLIYIPHLLDHAVSTLDTGSPRILSRWDAATNTNQ